MIAVFTGIIEELGTIEHISRGRQSARLSIAARKVLEEVKLGDSIAVNGVCLTVAAFSSASFTCDVMPETMDKTTLHMLQNGASVNLERALRLQDRLGGHLVQGHVDAIGVIAAQEKLDIAVIFRIQASDSVLKYTVPKGSIAIDGISLTVIDVFPDSFTVSLIPHTAQNTTLVNKKSGQAVNLESDIIGRYVEHLLRPAPGGKNPSSMSMGFLAEHGFL